MLKVHSNGLFAQNCYQKNSQNDVCIIVLATAGLLFCRMMAKLAQSALRKAGFPGSYSSVLYSSHLYEDEAVNGYKQ